MKILGGEVCTKTVARRLRSKLGVAIKDLLVSHLTSTKKDVCRGREYHNYKGGRREEKKAKR